MTAGRYPFTPAETTILQAAYAALTRVGRETADDFAWDEHIDRAHHGLAILLVFAGMPPDLEPWPTTEDPPSWPPEPPERPTTTVYLPGDHPRTHRPPSA